jgi:hypothetical protein
MTADGWVLWGVGLVVAAVNVATTRRLWASAMFERPQKIAQTVLLWLVPGSFLLVRYLLDDTVPKRRQSDSAHPTADAGLLQGVSNDWSSGPEAHDAWGGGHHGGSGHHGGGDFGSGHG